MSFVRKWLVGIAAILITVYILHFLPPTFRISWSVWWGAVVFVPILAITNALIGTILRLASAPISCLTLGLFGFVINALVFWIAGVETGAKMGFLAAMVGSVLYTVVSTPLNSLLKERK
ncbi:MAG: phage holin family protein [Armatimonadota bacterium]|nr:phage holin family protein [bacterium]